MIAISNRERDTILAGLRLFQKGGGVISSGIQAIATNGETAVPLSPNEIDDLCERINVEHQQ